MVRLTAGRQHHGLLTAVLPAVGLAAPAQASRMQFPDGFEYRPATVWETEKSMRLKNFCAAAAVTLIAIAGAPETAYADGGGCTPSPSVLCAGSVLYPDQFLQSPNGYYRLYMQADGNLTVLQFQQVGDADGHEFAWRAVWASNTAGFPGTRLQDQFDGNVVLVAPGERPIWATNTDRHPGSRIQIQDDRNVVVYYQTTALWATDTAPTMNCPPNNPPGNFCG